MIVSTLREMRAKFSYCSDLMSSTEYDPILVQAVAAVVKMDMKEHRIISGSGQISKIKVEGWRITHKRSLESAISLLQNGVKYPPKLLNIYFGPEYETAKKELKELAKETAKYDCEVNLILKHSLMNYDPVDEVITSFDHLK